MFVTLSATPLSKYEWYIYKGKKKVYEEHNKDYDLALSPKDIIGIRKVKNKEKYKLVDKDDTSIIFNFTTKEIDKIVAKSKGYSGRLNGVKLLPGVGGLDEVDGDVDGNRKRLKAAKTLAEALEYDTKIYPAEFPLPPTKEDILRLYHYYNKLYWKGVLPDKISIKKSRAIKFEAQARLRGKRNTLTGEQDYKYYMDFAPKSFVNVPYFVDVLLHEMIHIHHYVKFFQDRDQNYLNAAHGPLFLEEMHALNAKGHKVELTGTGDQIVMIQPTYVLVIYYGDKPAILHSFKPFEDKIGELIKDANISLGMDATKYSYGISDHSSVLASMQLTTKSTIPGNRKVYLYKLTWSPLHDILTSLDVIEENKLEDKTKGKDIRASFKTQVDRHVAWKETSWFLFLRQILKAVDTPATSDDAYSESSLVKYAESVLTEDELIYAHDSWKDVPDKIIIKSGALKELRKTMLREDIDGKPAALLVMRYYYQMFASRVSMERWKVIALKVVGDIITMPDDEFIQALLEAPK